MQGNGANTGNGQHKRGRKLKLDQQRAKELVDRWAGGESIPSLCRRFGIAVTTVYRVIDRAGP